MSSMSAEQSDIPGWKEQLVFVAFVMLVLVTMASAEGLLIALVFIPIPSLLGLAFTVCAVRFVNAFHPPRITAGQGVRRWLPWVFWGLALIICPIAIVIIGTLHARSTPYQGERPLPARLVDWLAISHLVISFLASLAVLFLATVGWRWIAWWMITISVSWIIAGALYASMATTGVWL